jgi:hypothetical protein
MQNCNQQHDIRKSEHFHIPGLNHFISRIIHSKTIKFLQILELVNNTLKPNLVQRSTILKLYKTLALSTILYGSKIWTLKNMTKVGFEPQK